MAISGFWKNGGKRYLVGRWCFVDVKKVEGRDVRRRRRPSREEESWLVEDYGAGMERRAAGGVGRLAPEGNELSCWMLWGWYEKRICSGRY